MLTFIVSLDDGVEAAESAEALPAARPNPLLLGGLHVHAAHVRQRPGQTGVQLAVHPLAARALFGTPSAELNAAEWDATAVLGRSGIRLRDRVSEARDWGEAFGWIAEYLSKAWWRRDGTTARAEVAHAWQLLALSGGQAPVGCGGRSRRCDRAAFDDAVPPRSRPVAEDGRNADEIRAGHRCHRGFGAALCDCRSRGGRGENRIQRSSPPDPRICALRGRAATSLDRRGVPKHSRRRPYIRRRLPT